MVRNVRDYEVSEQVECVDVYYTAFVRLNPWCYDIVDQMCSVKYNIIVKYNIVS